MLEHSRTAHGVCLLHMAWTIYVLSGTQSGLSWIVGNVSLEAFALFRPTNKVIKTLFLPEASGSHQAAIDFSGGELIPQPALSFDLRGSRTSRPANPRGWA